MLGSLCKKVVGLRCATFLKIDLNTGVSSGYSKIYKNSFHIQHLWWLLLKFLPWYSKVSWSACSLISCLHVLSILIKNFHETLRKYFFTITRQNNFFFALTDWSRAFNFKICFRKTSFAFHFDEKLTQSVAQVIM